MTLIYFQKLDAKYFTSSVYFKNHALPPATRRIILLGCVMIGWREWVGTPELDSQPFKAKIDTGAWSNTMHAVDIEVVESDIETHVRFRLEEGGDWIERPLYDWRRVRDTGGHDTLRPVIRTCLEIAGGDYDIELCLQDRSRMRHRMIIGRKFLRIGFVINPQRQCIHKKELSAPRITINLEI